MTVHDSVLSHFVHICERLSREQVSSYLKCRHRSKNVKTYQTGERWTTFRFEIECTKIQNVQGLGEQSLSLACHNASLYTVYHRPMNLQPELSSDTQWFFSHLSTDCNPKSTLNKRLSRKLSAWMEEKKWPKFSFSELKQGRRRRQRERHPKMELRVSVMISQLFQVILPAKCILSVLE